MEKSLWDEWRCPYQSDLICLLWPNPFKMNGIDEKWVNRVKWDEMSDLMDFTLWTLWESPYGRKRVSLSKWLDLFVVTKSFQNDQNRWEMSELSEMKWNEWFDGFDLEQPYEKVPMVEWRWTLSKWLDVSENECPYQNEWNRWEMNELKWIEWNEVKWVIWWKWLCEPYGNGPMVLWSVEGVPINLTWLNPMRMSLSKWSESMRNEWIEWIEVKWVIWWKWLGTTLWEWSYESVESVPMEVTGMNPMRKSLSKWMESMRNEWIEVE